MILGAISLALAAPAEVDCPALPSTFASAAFEKLTDSEDAKKADISDASRRARERAASVLYDRLAPSLPPVARKGLRARIGTQELDSVPKGGNLYRVCVFAFVEAEYLDRLRLDDEAFRQQLEVLAAGVDRLRGESAVAIDVPRNADDCPVGPLGKALKSRLQTVLANRAVRWSDSEKPNVARLRVTVNPDDAAGVSLAARLDVPGQGDQVAEGFGFVFNPSVLVEDVDAAVQGTHTTCTANVNLGLDAYGHRAGDGGTTVSLVANRELDHVTAGEEVDFTVTVSRDALVQVYSIDPGSGVAYLVLPDGERGGHAVTPAAPWTFRLVFDALPEPRPEQLLALAVPSASRLGDASAWQGFCRVPTGRSPSDFGPREAARHLVRFLVDPGSTVPANPPPGTVTECGSNRTHPYP